MLFELALRLGGPIAPGEYQTVGFTDVSSEFSRVNMANRAGWKQSREFRTHVRVNAQGLRGPDVPYAPAPDTFRILVLGDSFTFGAQVDEDETFVVRLGHHLRKAAARSGWEQREIETINAGVDGWSTVDEVAWLRAEGVRYEPDLVILMFFTGNDPGENFDRARAAWRKADRQERPASATLDDGRRFLASVSATYALFETGVLAKLAPRSADSVAADDAQTRVRRSTDPNRKERGWEMSGDLLREMRELCDQKGIQLLVVGIPTVEHVADAERPPTPIQTLSQSAGAQVIDLLDPFRALAPILREELYFPKDRHWTRQGHEAAARRVAADLVDGRLLQVGYLRP